MESKLAYDPCPLIYEGMMVSVLFRWRSRYPARDWLRRAEHGGPRPRMHGRDTADKGASSSGVARGIGRVVALISPGWLRGGRLLPQGDCGVDVHRATDRTLRRSRAGSGV